MSEPILTVDHLRFGFRDQQLYQDLSFHLDVGSMTSLVGPNGVGKTTLIRLLMGQLKPQAGTIRFVSNLQFDWDMCRSFEMSMPVSAVDP